MLEHRFTSKFVESEDGCWLWTAAKSPRGYGVFQRARSEARELGVGRHQQAHRYAYEQLVGAIPDGLELDHLCRNPSCVNPAHLEPVTHGENLRRGAIVGGALWDGDHAPTRAFAARTHCKYGHEFTPENTFFSPLGSTHRRCRECSRIVMRVIGPPKPAPTHCKHGHEFTPENTYVKASGKRECRECIRLAQRRYQARKRG